MELHFYYCTVCGKILTVLSYDGIPTFCCGEAMVELSPNLTDTVAEKHVPVFCTDTGTVRVHVGSVPHPMTEAHSIVWVGLRTKRGFQFAKLSPGDRPEACFALAPGDEAEAVYAFCDVHGLWCAKAPSGTCDPEVC